MRTSTHNRHLVSVLLLPQWGNIRRKCPIKNTSVLELSHVGEWQCTWTMQTFLARSGCWLFSSSLQVQGCHTNASWSIRIIDFCPPHAIASVRQSAIHWCNSYVKLDQATARKAILGIPCGGKWLERWIMPGNYSQHDSIKINHKLIITIMYTASSSDLWHILGVWMILSQGSKVCTFPCWKACKRGPTPLCPQPHKSGHARGKSQQHQNLSVILAIVLPIKNQR